MPAAWRMAQQAIDEHGAMQKVRELAQFIAFLRGREIRNVLEIGGQYGGTMWVWSQIATGRLICVDLFVLEGRMEHADCDFEMVVGNSHDPETRRLVVDALAGEQVDLLFIDGDHRYDAVRADFDAYRGLVAPGGVIGIHDTHHRVMEDHDMPRFWREVSARCESFDIFDKTENWGGIGVLLP